MKIHKTILKALVALMVIMLGANLNAEAQLGGLINKAKQAKDKKEGDKAAKAFYEEHKAAIPQPKQGDVVKFNLEYSIGIESKNGVAAQWDPSKLELTILTDRNGLKSGTVVKLDPSTGKWTDSDGNAMGAMSADGTTIESVGFGTLKLKEVTEHNLGNTETLAGYDIIRAKDNKKLVFYRCNSFGGIMTEDYGKFKWGVNKCEVSDKTINSMLAAYVYFGLIFADKDVIINQVGFDLDKTYTEAWLREHIVYKDEAANAQILKIEKGFLDYDPKTKGGKIAEIGLMSRWIGEKCYKNRYQWNEYEYTEEHIDYWIVYEMPDGKNKVAFYQLTKNRGDRGITERSKLIGIHYVADWQRK